ncbi:cytochrome P450 [Aspergillus terricola var. indicus]
MNQKYGPIIGLKFGPMNVVILNNWRDVEQLLEKRGHIYSSRPSNYIANGLICPDDTHILFAPYGKTWKAQRRAAQGLLTPRELATILPSQQAEAVQTAYDFVRDPGRCYEHIERYTTAVILASVIGQRGENFESPNIQALYDVQNRFTALLEPGAALPNETKARMRRGVRTGCFMEKLIDEQAQNKLDDEHAIYLGGILMEPAQMQLPALKTAQEEIDRVCGGKRSQTMDDLENLPYIEACMHEALRWRPVAAGGIPRMLMQTDTYKDFAFPAGTIFFANTWTIHHDEVEYDDPAAFKPERFLGGSYGFGVGRRICSGQKMAEASIKINVARIVWGFNLEKAPGNPPDISIETGYSGGFVIHQNKFCHHYAEERAALIQEKFEALKGFYESLSA